MNRKSDSIWSPTYTLLIVVNFFQSMAAQIANTTIPLYARSLGITTASIGVIVASFTITAIAIRPFSGPAFDSFPKKTLFFGASLINMIAMVLYSFAASTETLFAVRLLHGVGIGCAAPLGMAICNQVLPPSRISSGISIYMLAFTVAQAIGPAFAVWFTQSVSYQPTFIISGLLLAVACVLVLFLRVPEVRNRPRYQIRLNRIFAKQGVITATVLFMLSAAMSATGSFLVIYGMLAGVNGIGLYFTVSAVCMLITRPLFGRISDSKGTTTVFVPAAVCFAVSYAIIATARTLPTFLVAAAVGACGYGICSPLLQALTFKMVPQQRAGAASNTTYVGLDLGNLLGPSLAGMLVDFLAPVSGSELAAYSDMWLALIVPIVAGLVFYLSQLKKIRRNIEKVEASRS